MIEFESEQGLYLFFVIIPFILIYMIKAKPNLVTLPSIIFFSDDKKVKKYNSFLQKLLVRLLMLIQLFCIIMLCFAGTNPIVTLPVEAYSLNTVVVVDDSASMATLEGVMTRLDFGKERLIDEIKGKTTIILAEQDPVVLASNISASKARAFITSLKPKDISGRLDSAIILANNLLGENKGTIIVYSDFMIGPGDEFESAIKMAEASEKKVLLLPVGSPQKNVGFVGFNLQRGTADAFIKNFHDRPRIVDLVLKVDGQEQQTQRIEIKGYSIETVNFGLKSGDTTMEIVDQEPFMIDNTLYIHDPYEQKIKLLMITNNDQNNDVLDALKSNPYVDVQVTIPPVVPDLSFDIVVVCDVDKNMLLPNTFRDLLKYTEQGGQLIMCAQEDMSSLDLQGLFDFDFGSSVPKETEICIKSVVEMTSQISNPPCFARVSGYIGNDLDINSSGVLAATKEGVPVFVLERGRFYYGILDKKAGFKDQINYPLFWNSLINSMLGRESLSLYNFKTGDISFEESNKSSTFEKTGFVDNNGRRVAVNLLDEYESDVTRIPDLKEEQTIVPRFTKVQMDVNISDYFLYAGILFLIFELFYVKRRGDF